MKYLTSDLHFSHKKITEYTDRKLVTTQQDHDEWLSEIISSSLKPGDELWILGDVVFKDTAWEYLQPISNKGVFFNVIKGNHDATKTLNAVKNKGIIKSWSYYHEIEIKGVNTCLFHYPISSWNWRRYGSYHLFGHLHGNPSGLSGRILDVGIDNAYNIFGKHKLFSEDEVHEILNPIDFNGFSHHNRDSDEYILNKEKSC